MSKEMCGFTGGESDTLRKAIGKKKRDVMDKMGQQFIDGAISNGVPQKVVEKIWKDILGFADYAFNKSHSACYGLIAYQTAYLKAHYPSAFMAALMTSDYDDMDRLSVEITECRHVGIEVLPPDVQESFLEFAVVPQGDPLHDPIRFGMNAVKNVGTGAVEEIIKAREINKFEKLEDLFSGVSPRVVNRKAVESLVKAGAFDRFGDRNNLFDNIDNLLAFSNRIQKERVAGQVGLFADENIEGMEPKIVLEATVSNFNKQEQLKWERELLGLYLSEHPLKTFETYLAELTMPINGLKPEMDGKSVVIGGAIQEMREITTKKGQKMAFVKIADLMSEVEVILFPSTYQQTSGIWERDKVVLVRGKLNSKDRQTGEISEEIKILADEAREITVAQADAYQSRGRTVKLPSKKSKSALAKTAVATTAQTKTGPKKLYVRLVSSEDQDKLLSLKKIIDKNAGDTDVVLVVGKPNSKQIIKLPNGVGLSDVVISDLRKVVGEQHVIIQ